MNGKRRGGKFWKAKEKKKTESSGDAPCVSGFIRKTNRERLLSRFLMNGFVLYVDKDLLRK